MEISNVTAQVQAQYEELPYPMRDPADEARQLQAHTNFYGIDRINDQCFNGTLDISKGIRVLIAGGGTGDGLVSIGEQLRHTPSEIMYVDISGRSLAIARDRAERREIPNIEWCHGSLLGLDPADVGKFDYVDSVGVLHHLEDPQAGLQALADVLRPEGAMGVMVYGKYGRAKVYEAQSKIKPLITPAMTRSEQLAVARRFLEQNSVDISAITGSHDPLADATLYDLLLHAQDRHPFTVPDMYRWLAAADLQLISFVDTRVGGGFGYDPNFYLPQEEQQVAAYLPLEERQALAERLSGKMRVHSLYAAKRAGTVALSSDPDMVPSFSVGIGARLREEIAGSVIAQPDAPLPIARLTNGRRVYLPAGRPSVTLFSSLDGTATLREIAIRAAEEQGVDSATLRKELAGLIDILRLSGWVNLRHSSLPPFVTAEAIQKAQLARQGTPEDDVVVLDVGAQMIEKLLADIATDHTCLGNIADLPTV